jgi:hypothetical protein
VSGRVLLGRSPQYVSPPASGVQSYRIYLGLAKVSEAELMQ